MDAPGHKNNPIEIDHPDEARSNQSYIIRPKEKPTVKPAKREEPADG